MYCVNDGAVMQVSHLLIYQLPACFTDPLTVLTAAQAWSEKLQVGGMVTMLADTSAHFTRALGMSLSDKDVMNVLGNPRAKRFAMVVEDGLIKGVFISAAPGDPAGDADPSASCVDNVLAQIGSCVSEVSEVQRYREQVIMKSTILSVKSMIHVDYFGLNLAYFDAGGEQACPVGSLKMMNFELKMMDFALNMMDFVSKMMDFAFKLVDSALKMMDFALNMMDFALKMMDFVFK